MDFSWSELLVVGIVALIVIGPKDLPGMFRELGRFTAKIRAMGREFSRAMEQAAKETGVQDVADDLKKVANPKAMGLDAMKSAADKFEKWDPMKNAAKPSAPMPVRTAADGTAAAALVGETADAAAEAAPVKGPLTPPPMGPSTAALAEQQAARKAVAAEAAEKLRKVSAAPAEAAAVDPVAVEAAPPAKAKAKAPGRVRKTVAKADGGAA
jgi:sec-independent protein translocase protein TatB